MKFLAWLVIVALVTLALVSQPLAADHVVAVESNDLRSGDDSIMVGEASAEWVMVGLFAAYLAIQMWQARFPRPDPDTGTMARDANLDVSTEWLTDQQIADALAR